MDPDGFQRDWDIPTGLLHSPSEVSVATWDKRVIEVLDQIAPMQPLPFLWIPLDLVVHRRVKRVEMREETYRVLLEFNGTNSTKHGFKSLLRPAL